MSDANLMPAEKMRALTGLSDKQLRAIADKGYFPAPDRGQYNATATLVGLFKYYREKEEAALDGIYFDGLKNAAPQLKVPEAALKSAKKKGCPAFKGNRFYLLPLIQWLLCGEGGEGSEDWFQQKAKVQTLRERVKLKHDEKQAADWGAVAFGINRATAMLFSRLEKLFSLDLPPDLERKSALEIKTLLINCLPVLVADFRAELEKLGQLDEAGPRPKEKKE